MPQRIVKEPEKIIVTGVAADLLPKHSRIVFVPLGTGAASVASHTKSNVHGTINSDGTWIAEFNASLSGRKYMLFIGDSNYDIVLPLSPGRYDVSGLIGV
jgi:hypothetical protein